MFFRTRHLICERNNCEEFTVLHLGFLDYAHYILTIRFFGLEAFHQRYSIKDLKFYVSTVSVLRSKTIKTQKNSVYGLDACNFSLMRRKSLRRFLGFISSLKILGPLR